MKRTPKVLVLRGGALGDFIVTLPALAALRRQWPEAEIELAGNATAAVLAKNRGLLQALHSQHEARWSALYSAAALPVGFRDWLGGFDVVVNYWPDPDGTLARHFPVRRGQRFVSGPAMPTRAPAAAHYCDALLPLIGTNVPSPAGRAADRSLSDRTLDGAENDPAKVFARYFYSLRNHGAPALASAGEAHAPVRRSDAAPIAIHPGSGSPRKNWPAEHWMTVIASLSSPILLIVGEAEAAPWSAATIAGSALAPRWRDGSLRIASNLALEELVAQLESCRLFLGHDSGVSHLAAATGVPCLLLFGPTDPAMWAPPADHVTVLHCGNDVGAISVACVEQALGALGEAPAGHRQVTSSESVRPPSAGR